MKLTNNLSIESLIEMYEKQGFDYQQMTQIKKGLMNGIDVSIYAHTGYSAYLMQMACSCILAGIPINKLTTRSGKLSAIKVSQKYTLLTHEQTLGIYGINK